jgi:hypothetical protein
MACGEKGLFIQRYFAGIPHLLIGTNPQIFTVKRDLNREGI